MGKKYRIVALLAGGIALVAGITWYGVATRVEAACGASVSSCKTCHEIQGKLPVSKKGDWHSQHAFGDFCEFCHGGITKETTAEKAHQGMRKPLEDPQKSCGSCHAPDLATRVAKYGGSAPASGGAPAPAPAASTDNGNTNSGTPAPASSSAPATSGKQDLLDFNRRLPGESEPVNRGNQVLWGLNALAAVGLAGTYWLYEKKPKAAKARTAAQTPLAESLAGMLPAEHAELVSLLARCDTSTLRALERVLQQEGGSAFVRRLARMDLSLVGRLEHMSQDELFLVLSLARGQKN